MGDQAREMAPTGARFVRNTDIDAEPVTLLEGVAHVGEASAEGAGLAIKPLLATEGQLLMEVHRKAGLVDTEHAHPDHESICYLVSGRMRVVIDGAAFIAVPGDSWVHPAGVPHFHETIEDSVQIEIKSPPRKTWS